MLGLQVGGIQAAKLAAFELAMTTEPAPAPERLGGVLINGDVRWALPIPWIGSFIARGSFGAPVPGLDTIHQLLHEPEMRIIFADAVVGPRLKITESILEAAVAAGDIDPATITPLTARIGPALINHHFLLTGEPPNRRELAQVVDTVIPPRAAEPSAQAE